MSVLCPPRYVVGPVPTRSRFGLYSVAQIIDSADDHDQCGVEAETTACLLAQSWSPVCPPTVPATKTFVDGIPTVQGAPWVAVAGVKCRLVGKTVQELQDRATAALNMGEERAAEFVLWTGGVTGGPAGVLAPRLADPTCTVLNTTPGAAGAFSVTDGLAALEDYAAATYAGNPIIHGPRGAGALAASQHLVVRDGQVLNTPIGSLWAFGAGYSAANTGPDGTPAPDGTAWLYVTGALQVRRSSVLLVPGEGAEGFNRSTNEITMLAERTITILRDCLCGAVLVSLSAC